MGLSLFLSTKSNTFAFLMITTKAMKWYGSFIPCAISLTGACICLGLIVLQSARVTQLEKEMQELRERTSLLCRERELAISHSKMSETLRNTRERRGVSGVGRRRRTGRNVFLHLQPLSSLSNEEDDSTLVKWTAERSLGEGLLVTGETVTVVTEGTYFIYSQVLYRDTTWTMGHVIKKRLHGTVISLMKCIQSMPSNITVAQNTCFTAGVHFLEPGSTLELIIPRKSAGFVLKAHSTFLGMFRI